MQMKEKGMKSFASSSQAKNLPLSLFQPNQPPPSDDHAQEPIADRCFSRLTRIFRRVPDLRDRPPGKVWEEPTS